VKIISKIIQLFFICVFFGFGLGRGQIAAESPDTRHTEKEWEFFIRRAEVIKMPIQSVMATDTLPFPQNMLPPSDTVYIVSLDMVVLKNGEPWRFDDETGVQYELRDTQGRVMNFLNEERGSGDEPSPGSPEDLRPFIAGPDGVRLYFQSWDEFYDNLVLTVDAAYPDMNSPFELLIPFEQICFVPGSDQNRPPQDSDIEIVFPKNNVHVLPGQTVPLKIQFAEYVKKPDKLLILSPLYSLEDRELACQYSLRIEPDASPGPYEVLIIGVWNMDHQEVTASKLLSLNVIEHKSDDRPSLCPLSRRR